MQICFATNNSHKIGEVKAILGDEIKLLSLKEIGCFEELPETQNSIRGNAIQKSKYVWDHFRVPCFADDSGLEVNALYGAPGVDSAHYAGPQRSHADNIRLLLKNMEGVSQRDARFITIISLYQAGVEKNFEGVLEGTILREARGTMGFGYDPVFLPKGSTLTLAEMTPELKNSISHRRRAVDKLVNHLRGK
jgi:XTP/dITP diphosphohydrolase